MKSQTPGGGGPQDPEATRPRDGPSDGRREWYDKLSAAAWERFRDRRSYEWKMFFGVWTAFGSAAGFLLGSQRTLGIWSAAVASILAVAVLVGLLGPWLRYIQRSNFRDQKTSYYWHSAVEWYTHDHLPSGLRPGESNPWLRYTGPQESSAQVKVDLPKWRDCFKHPAVIGQVIISAALALLFLTAVWSKPLSTLRSQLAASRLSGLKVQVKVFKSSTSPDIRKLEVLASDMDENGVVELWTLAKGNDVLFELRDVDQDDIPDWWDSYEKGVRRLTVKDRNNDGRPDYWQIWMGKDKGSTIWAVDDDFDGKIDQEFEGTFETAY